MKPVYANMLTRLVAQRPAVLVNQHALPLCYVDDAIRRYGIASRQGKRLPTELWLMILEQAREDVSSTPYVLARPQCVETDGQDNEVLVCGQLQPRESLAKYILGRKGTSEQYQQSLDGPPREDGEPDSDMSPFHEPGEKEETVIRIPAGVLASVVFTEVTVSDVMEWSIHGEHFD